MVSEWERIKDKQHRNLGGERECVVRVDKMERTYYRVFKILVLYTTDIKMLSFRTKIFWAIGLLLLRL